MIRKIWKFLKTGIWSITLAVILCVSSLMVSASNIPNDVRIEETDEDYAEDISYSRLRGSHLNFGSIKISKLSSNEVNLYGLTQCHHVSGKVWLKLSLEKKVNGVYETYKMWEFTKEDASNLDKSINVKVEKGTYYRLRGYHAASDGGERESTTTLTSGISL